MKIIDNKYVLLRTRRPELVTEKVPEHRVIKEDADGFCELSVKWEQTESQALASLGVSVPSPIQRDYKWTGKFTPFDHQRTTAARRLIYFCYAPKLFGGAWYSRPKT